MPIHQRDQPTVGGPRRTTTRERRPVLSKSQVSRMAADLDEQVIAFRTRPLGEAGPFTFVAADALTMKVREHGRVVNAVVLVATPVAGVVCVPTAG